MGVVCALVSCTIAYAEGPVKEGNAIVGHVIEKGSEAGLPYATVLLVETGEGTVTDAGGYFRFKKLPAGEYTLKVQIMGYTTQVKKVTVSKDFVVDMHFVMEEESIMTDEVVVSANRNETSRKVAPVVVNVMSNKLFEIVNSTDLAKSLNYQSGLRVENNCQNCGFPQVRINGLEGPYSQILINSRPVMSALSGVYGLEQIPTNMIERVEVVRGGGSALFGANAVGGTINIITKDPVRNSFQVASTMSNLNGKVWEQYMGANASLVSSDNSYGIALYQSYRNRNPYDADVIKHEKSINYSAYPTSNYTPDDWRRYRYAYFRLVEHVDAEIGKLVDAIDRNGLWKNTVIIFTSDHGDGMGAHQWNQKSALYEEVINIPMIVVLPGKKNAGKELPQLVNNGVDFFASVCEWAGVDMPEGLPGCSYKKLVEGCDVNAEHQDFVVTETLFDKGGGTRGWALRTKDFKYVMYDKGLYREQLFDMNADRGEMRNLAVEKKYESELKRHRALLNDWMKQHKTKQIRAGLNLVPGF